MFSGNTGLSVLSPAGHCSIAWINSKVPMFDQRVVLIMLSVYVSTHVISARLRHIKTHASDIWP